MRRLALTTALVLVIGIAGCRTAPIENIAQSPLAPPAGTRPTLAQVSQAIVKAGQELGWVIQEVRPGELTGTLDLRRHVAVVSIAHTTSTFSITYKDSRNLMHSGDEIHRKYNLWVQNLARHIRAEVGRLGAAR